MKENTIGVDLAKNVLQVHGAAADGSVLFRKKLSRSQFALFMAEQAPCLGAMAACASAHHRAREMGRIVVAAAGFEKRDASLRILAQPAGRNASCAARADDDDVELVRDGGAPSASSCRIARRSSFVRR